MSVSVGEELCGSRVEAIRASEPALVIADGTRAGAGVRLLVAPLADAAAGLDAARLIRDQDRYRIGAGGVARVIDAAVVELASGGRALAAVYDRPTPATWADIARSRLSRVHIAELGRRLARAIAPLHDQGIAHGLLRAELVAVSEPNVWVLGFGFEPTLRAFVGAAGANRAMAADSLAPELRSGAGGSPTLASDVFAFGVLVKLLLAGRESAEVGALLAKALAQSPLERPSDLIPFAEELGRAIEIEPIVEGAAPAPVVAPQTPPPVAAPVAAAIDEVSAAPEPAEALAEPAPEPSAPVAPVIAAEPSAPVGPVIAAEPPPAEPLLAGPEPAPQPPPALPPLAPPPASTRSGSSAGLWIIASILGVLLILGGVFGLFAFALLRPRPAPTVVAVSASDAGSGAPLVEEPDAGASSEPDAGAQSGDDAGAPETFDGGAPIELGDGGVARTNPKSRSNVALEAIVPLPVTPEVAVWGGRKPLITIVWFGDLECPHTRHAYTTMVALERAFGDELRIAFRHRPLSIHTRARPAARVAAGLRREKGDLVFRSFLSSVSASSDAPTTERLEAWVEGVGGDRSRVNDWMNQRETETELARDLAIAALYDVRETPTFFVNGIRIEGDLPFDDFKPIVEKELSAARALMSLGTPLADIYAARVRKNMLGLGTDVVSRTCPAIAGSPARGPNDALVTIVEFSDFECPFCKRVQTPLQTVLARHGGDVRLVWKNFPLEFHPHARPAATFALEAEKRGGPTKFWKVHDRLFASQSNLDEAGLASIAAEVGLDGDALLDAVRRRSHDAKIEADVKLAKQLGVRGTPTFFINGRALAGAQPAERFEAVVQEEIDGARRLVGSGTPRSRVYDAVCGAH